MIQPLKFTVSAAIVVGAIIFAFGQVSQSQGQKMQKDITLVLEGNLARDGGLVVVQIIETDLTGQVVVPEPQTVTLSAQVSIVNIPIEKGQNYEYRFLSPEVPSIRTDRFSVGSTSLPDDGGQTTLLYHYVDSNSDWTLGYSTRVASALNIGAVNLEYPCVPENDILVCDASSVLSGPLPE